MNRIKYFVYELWSSISQLPFYVSEAKINTTDETLEKISKARNSVPWSPAQRKPQEECKRRLIHVTS